MIPQVVASERGRAQTEPQQCGSGFGPAELLRSDAKGGLKAATTEGDSPVTEAREQGRYPEYYETRGIL